MKGISSLALAAVLATTPVYANNAPIKANMDKDTIRFSAQDSGSTGDGWVVALLGVSILIAILNGSGFGRGGEAVVTAAISDANLKTDIEQVGVADNGLPIYTYRYIGTEPVFKGVLAQDVQAMFPQAVSRHSSGYLMVDYKMLGIMPELVE